MPTKRRRVMRGVARRRVSEALLAFLSTGVWPADGAVWEVFDFDYLAPRERRIETWQAVRSEVMAAWVSEAPGTRPMAWWWFDAPRCRPEHLLARCRDVASIEELAEPRLRLGGIGTPCHEALNYMPSFDRGIPSHWVSASDVAHYNGRATDVQGRRIGTEYFEGHFPWPAIDHTDPPRFESEAAYLQRHGVLTAAEMRALPPTAFEPVRVGGMPEEPHETIE